jgi:hypothetical protein
MQIRRRRGNQEIPVTQAFRDKKLLASDPELVARSKRVY